MTTTISHNATTITPALVLGYESSRAGRNTLHVIIGRSDVDVTVQPAALRKGTLNLFFPARADAWAAANLHAQAGRFVLVDTDLSQIGMTYVLDGAISPVLDDETRAAWTVAIDYQEVTA